MKAKFFRNAILAIATALIFSAANEAFAQGGKAEPLRIQFKKGANSAILTARLENDKQMDYVFRAEYGQKVSIKITSMPKGKYNSFSLTGDGFIVGTGAGEFYDLNFTAPKTGNYLIFVKSSPTKKGNSARFTLTLKIK